MFQKLTFAFLICLTAVLVFAPLNLVVAVKDSRRLTAPLPPIPPTPPNPPEPPEAPEAPGIYDEPGQPGMKVRVFSHPEKPKVTALPALVCGLPDLDSATTVHPAGWKLSPTVTYNLNPASAPSSTLSTNLPTISGNGFSAWSSAVSGRVSFSRGPNTSVGRSIYDGKNIIAWNRLSSGTLGITYIRYYPSTGQVVDVDTILNKRYSWSWSNSNTCADTNSYDTQNILTHEQGHWLGLDDEYDSSLYQDATMFGYGSKGEAKKNTLTAGDTAGAAAIY